MNKKTKTPWLKVITFAGCFATGIIYGGIGVIAILSFMQLKDGGADESSFMVLLDGFLFGRIINWIIIIGAVGFVFWRFYEAIKDRYRLGNDLKGLVVRTGAVFSSVADAFIAFSAIQALFSQHQSPEDGTPVQQRNLTDRILDYSWGDTLIFILGAIVAITALVLAFYGLSKRFAERINTRRLTTGWKHVVHILAYAGYTSRGIILGIIGFFFMKAAVRESSQYVVNTDKAFDFIGDHVGHVYFIIVAIGTIFYGLYMFVLGVKYDTDEDPG